MRALLIASMLLLSGCWTPAAPYTVMVVGDSIAVSFASRLAMMLTASDDAPLVLNNTVVGITASQEAADLYWVARIEEARSHVDNLDTLVVSLGGNDTSYLSREELSTVLQPALDAIMFSTSDMEVYWVIHAGGNIPNLDEYRRVVYETAAQYGVTVVDIPLGVLQQDEVHLTSRGVTMVVKLLLTEMETRQ